VNLRVTANTTTSITVAWDSVTGATRYEIFVNGWSLGSQTGTSVRITDVYYVYFSNGSQTYTGKTGSNYVRAMRAFSL
jgi:hypothetical protein